MIKGIHIKNLEPDDLPRLWELGKEVFSSETSFIHEWKAETLASITASDTSCCFIALQGKKPVGFLIGKEEISGLEPLLTIYWFGVSPRLQEKGIEEELLRAATKKATGEKQKTISVSLVPGSKESIILEKFHFTEKKQFVVMHLQQDR